MSTQPDYVSLKFISQHTFRDSSAVTRLIDTLKNKELLERTSTAYDKRIKLICISEKGMQIFKHASEVANEHVLQSLHDVKYAERDKLLQILIQIQNNCK